MIPEDECKTRKVGVCGNFAGPDTSAEPKLPQTPSFISADEGFLPTSLFRHLCGYKRRHSVPGFTVRSIGDAVLTPVSNAI